MATPFSLAGDNLSPNGAGWMNGIGGGGRRTSRSLGTHPNIHYAAGPCTLCLCCRARPCIIGASRGLVLRAQVGALRWQRLCIMGASRGLALHPHIFSLQSNGDVDVDKITVVAIDQPCQQGICLHHTSCARGRLPISGATFWGKL